MKTILEKYREGEKLLLKHTHNAVLNGKSRAVKLDDKTFYYAKESSYPVTEYEYVKVDMATGNKEALFDHEALRKALKDNGLSEKITFGNIEYGKNIKFTLDNKNYLFDGKSLKEEELNKDDPSVYSDKYRVYHVDGNLYREDLKTHEVLKLTDDASTNNGYGTLTDEEESITKKVRGIKVPPIVTFSNSGDKIVTFRLDERKVKDMFIIEAYDNGSESIRPRLHTYKNSLPEDENVPLYHFCIIDLKTGKLTYFNHKAFYMGFGMAKWSEDDSYITATFVDRGYQDAEMMKVNPLTGECEILVNEHTDTFLNLCSYGQLDGYGEYSFSNFITKDESLAIFQSERDDFARYFAYDTKTKECLGAITPEDIIAENIIHVDEDNKYIYFMAGCLKTNSDPYYEGLCRVHFDGTGFEILTKDDATHSIQYLGDYFLDTYSRVDLPPVTKLYTKDGDLVSVIEKADISNLLNLGYIIPQRFTVKARDGVTDLYGILIEPEHEEGEEVPYVDHIYGGPQTFFVPKAFTYNHPMGREIFGGLQTLAKTGIAGIMIDGLGTPGRGKKLHDYSWQNIHGCNGLLDHVTMAKELKEKFPFIDITRVGIWGNSGGGCATSRALLEYPDYFKVGVSTAGNHDQRMFSGDWTERYYGLYNKDHKDAYLTGDNTALAKNLKGKLLIVHGMMDDNVTMSQSIRLIDALIREDKNFDFLILPRVNHNVPADPYFQRIKLNYFVKHLLHIDPPEDYHFGD